MQPDAEGTRRITGPGGHDVRKPGEGEISEMSRAIARAFFEDPLSLYVLPDSSSRLRISEAGVELFLRRAWFELGETYAVGEPAAGVCIWNPPGTSEIGISKQLSMLPALIRVYGRNLPRLLAALQSAESKHPKEPHYYLPMLGVEPDHQGHGMGSALMYPVLSRCDAEGIPAYLESSTPRNRALYVRHGSNRGVPAWPRPVHLHPNVAPAESMIDSMESDGVRLHSALSLRYSARFYKTAAMNGLRG